MAATRSRRSGTAVLPPRYREAERLAGGGMGEVYRAIDAELERRVAVKLLDRRYAADAELEQRFTREALAAARLSAGPNTVTIFDVGRWRGRPYLVMEYLAGGSLQDRLREEGPPSTELALRWLAEAGIALDHAHANGVVHRDVKPANLLLDQDDVLHVADFGIASAAGLEALTQTGTILGTTGYLAPEQAEGRSVTAAADHYALAVVAFELLTGRRPFQRDSPTAEAAAQLVGPIPSVTRWNGDLPTELDAVFAKGFATEPRDRFATCAELVTACESALRSEVTPTLVAGVATTRVTPGRNTRGRLRRRILAGLLLAAVAATGAVAASAFSPGHAIRETSVSIRTVTAAAPPPRTVTVTTAAPTQASGADAVGQARALMASGDYQAALPLLQQAVDALHGTGSAAEGNADYDLAYALTQLGSCDGVLPLLDRAQAVLGQQDPIDQIRAACTGPPGHRPNHDNGKGKGKGKGNEAG